MPEVQTATAVHIDLTQVAATLRDVATVGALLMPTDPIISQIRDLLGVMRPTDMIEGGATPGANTGQDGRSVLADSHTAQQQEELKVRDKMKEMKAKIRGDQNGKNPATTQRPTGRRKPTTATASRYGLSGRNASRR